MQSNKTTILSTRPLPANTIEEARKKDILIETIPFIRTDVIEEPGIKAAIERLSVTPATAVFTSMNAVEAVAAQLHQQPSWKIFTLGTATTSIAKEKFTRSTVSGGGENASLLADRIIEEGDVRSVVFFCGEQRRDELPNKLMQHSIRIEEITVYKTVNLSHVLAKTYDAIMFFSPSAVESFFTSNKVNATTILFAIGDTTATAIEQYATNKVITSDRPGKDALVDKVISYFNNNNQQK